jgi:malic enzyme
LIYFKIFIKIKYRLVIIIKNGDWGLGIGDWGFGGGGWGP